VTDLSLLPAPGLGTVCRPLSLRRPLCHHSVDTWNLICSQSRFHHDDNFSWLTRHVSILSYITLHYTSRRRLRSSASHRLEVPPVRLSTVGKQAFPVVGANMWNDLPFNVTSAQIDIIEATLNMSMMVMMMMMNDTWGGVVVVSG